VTLRDELDFVRDYLALEALRLGPRLQVLWQLDESAMDEAVPPLTLQPLVENSIAHGIAPRVAGGQVQISARRDGVGDSAGLHLSVADNGEGCDWPARQAVRGKSGVGLSALSRRFDLDYGGRARLKVHTAPNAGFRVDIFIPFETQTA